MEPITKKSRVFVRSSREQESQQMEITFEKTEMGNDSIIQIRATSQGLKV